MFQIRLYSGVYIDTVISFKPGTGQSIGQGGEYFPENIFGPPSEIASYNVPASSPEQVLSLGMGGEIIVSFKNHEIIDRPGVDFTIFENAFLNPASNRIFAEPGLVSVSYDGVNYLDFPIDSLTLESCAGTNPTYGTADPFNPDSSGGNSFDLADLGLEKVRFIKIKDITSILTPGHPYYDPILSGFDLDAVAAINIVELPVSVEAGYHIENYDIKKSGKMISIFPRILQLNAKAELFSIEGQLICSEDFNSNFNLIFRVNLFGVYILRIKDNNGIFIKKLLIYEN